ncbi:CLE16p like [Actinidia chinensis var. chinensis]|uniref:CLE16p like n=1 Tax=Actinidia chinensis var. chinensis TaxID=1590841 RepID=A0A2R6PAZ5_ACTCC|nr:CLE16p like [Actinidia chinensis var. chinensis]
MKKSSRNVRATIIPVLFFYLLILSQQLFLSSAKQDEVGRRPIESGPRKARFFGPAVSGNNHSAPAPAQAVPYEEDKRLVHTGPNPLHN